MGSRPRQAGYSLLDTLIGSLTFLVVLYAAYTLQQTSQDTYGLARDRAAMQQTARLALDRMEQDLRMAGYDTNKLSDPVVIATNDTVSIHANPDGTGAVYITYSVRDCTGAAGTVLYRIASTTTFCGGDPIADGVSSLQITYYEGNNVALPYPTPASGQYQLDSQGPIAGAGTPTAPAVGAQRDSARQMKIKLVLSSGSVQQPQNYTATTEVALRNLLP